MSPTRLLITAGPTHEPIDRVRYIANRSSGRLGIALAEAARDAGWAVTLLLGPGSVSPPDNVRTYRFTTTHDLQDLLGAHFPLCDVLIMAAAVGDYRPLWSDSTKLPRRDEKLVLELEPTPDLIARCAATKRPGQRIIGFALEPADTLHERAIGKLARKNLDAIVANPLETMDATTIDATVYTPEGGPHRPPTAPGGLEKPAFARWLIEWLGSTWPTGNQARP